MDPSNPLSNQPNSEQLDPNPSAEPVTPAAKPVVPVAPDSSPLPVAPVVPTSAPSEPVSPAMPVVTAPTTRATETESSFALSPVSPPAATVGGGRSKKRWLLPLVIVLVLLLAGGYVFGFYLPNRPGAVYSASLKNSGTAIDKLIAYSKQQSAAHYNSASLNGTLNVKSSSGSFDVAMNGGFDTTGNGSLSANIDAMGTKVAANLRSVHVANSTSPDIYLQFTGIKPLLDNNGLTQLDNLDGQWISIDHTLLETFTSSYTDGVSSKGNGSFPTASQLQDALTRVQTVNKQYLFTTDSSHAVLTGAKYLGKETKDGRSTYHYTVGYNKTHLQAYMQAVGGALDASQLNTWAKKTSGGKNLSQLMDLKSLTDSINKAKNNYTFDLWADTKTRLIHSLQFTDPAGSGSTFVIAQNYSGGDNYPFTFTLNHKNSAGTTDTSTLGLTLNTKSHQFLGKFMAGVDGASYNLAFTLTPSSKGVAVTAPVGSMPVTDILNQLGFGGLDAGSSSTTQNESLSFGFPSDTNASANDLFTLSQ